MKKLLSLMLVFAMVMTFSIPGCFEASNVYAASKVMALDSGTWQDQTAGITYYYDVIEGGCCITGVELNDPPAEYGVLDLVFPESITVEDKTYAVVDLECGSIPNAFKSVKIPSGITELDYNSGFMDAEYLETVTFAEDSKLKVIGDKTFKGNYHNIYRPDSTYGITTLEIPDSVTTIGEKAFYNTGLINVELPEALEEIGDYAFEKTVFTELVIPDNVINIGKYAFAYTETVDAYGGADNTTELASLKLGNSVENIGEGAFYKSVISSLALPGSLKSIGMDAFRESKELSQVTWAESPVEEFKTIDGFSCCPKLSAFEIPFSVAKIADSAFYESGLESIIIPSMVEEIGKYAFWKNQALTDITIMPGNTSLKIDEEAFYYCNNLEEVLLPERVSVIEDDAFGICPKAEITILNDSIKFMKVLYDGSTVEGSGDEVSYPITKYSKWISKNDAGEGNAIIYYPKSMTESTSPSFMAYMAACKSSDNPEYYPEFAVYKEASDECEITGTVPAGASVSIKADGENLSVETLDAVVDGDTVTMFTATSTKGSSITVTVSKDGYAEATFERKGAHFNSTWNLGNITLTELSNTGTLTVTTTGVGSIGANIILIDEDDNLAVSTKATGAASFIADIKKGTYTLLAFADNGYIDAVASEEDFAKLGITSYAKVNVTVKANSNTDISVAVPAFDVESMTKVLESSSLSMQQSYAVKNCEFFVRVNYELKSDASATKLNLHIPAEFTVTSAASKNTTYKMAAGNTININSKDSKKGELYIGLSSSKTGLFNISASLTTGVTTVPVGNASVTVSRVKLEIPGETQNGTFKATVYAEPKTSVKIKMGDGTEKTVATKANGIWTGELSLSKDTPAGSTVKVFASVEENNITYTVYDNIKKLEQSVRLIESYFVHANRRTYGMQYGRDVSGGYYTYVANGDEANKYWTFSATIESDEKYYGDVTLAVMSVTGVYRYEEMSLVKEYKVGDKFRAEYAVTTYIEQAGDHIFDNSLIPQGFDILFDSAPKAMAKEEPKKFIIEGYSIAQSKKTDRNELIEKTVADLGIDKWTPEERTKVINVIFGGGFNQEYEELMEMIDEMPEGDNKQQMVEAAKEVKENYDEITDFIPELLGIEESLDHVGTPEGLTEKAGIDIEENVKFNWDEPGNYTVAEVEGEKYAVQQTTNKKTTEVKVINKDNTQFTMKYYYDAGKNIGWSAGNQVLNKTMEYLIYRADKKELDALWATAINQGTRSKYANLVKYTKGATAVASVGYGVAQAIDNGQSMIDITEEYEKYNGELNQLETLEHFYATHGAPEECMNAVRKEKELLKKYVDLLNSQWWHTHVDAGVSATFTAATTGLFIASAGTSLVVADGLNVAYDIGSNYINSNRAHELTLALYNYEVAKKARKRHCGEDIKHPTFVYKACLDPSGVVYEAVESNTLEGVTATVYETTDGAVEWNAEDFDQVNPQVTDASGSYAWYVPTGKWQVKFTKPGYADATTDELDVPPPQMNLKTAMVSTEAPKVESVKAYTDCIEMVFSQYMNTTQALSVPSGYSYEWINKVQVSDTDKTQYSKVLRLKPAVSSKVGDSVSITLNDAVNYAGTKLPAYSSGKIIAAPRPAEIVLNYETTIAANAGESNSLTVRVKDNEGKFMSGVKVNASITNTYLAEISESAVTDSSGQAIFNLDSKLPGLTTANFSVEGTSVGKTAQLKISTESNQAARPTATIGTETIGAGAPKENYVTVEKGALLTLNCETDEARIYYTVNDTCPCQNGGERILYTGPITIEESGLYRVTAYKDGMEYSDRLNIHVTVADTHMHAYKKVVSKATDKKNGSVKMICECGDIQSKKTVYAANTIKLAKTAYVYDKKVKSPAAKVKDSKGNTLKKGTDFTVTYGTGRKNVGKYKVTIKGKGNYNFKKELYFKVNPKATVVKSVAAGKKSFTVKWAKKTVQVTGYEIQYSTKSNFKKGTATKTTKITSAKVTSKQIKNLKKKKKYYVRVRTYKTVKGVRYYSAWSKSKGITTK